ncbi:MAG: flagellin [Candidatus Brocadiia bacterium]|jgi:flagellin
MSSIAQIATNVNALKALNALNNINSQLSSNELKLATGLNVNSAADNPADYEIGTGLQSTANGLTQALANVNDGQSLLGIAQGGQQEIQSILQTMQTEATQAANGTLGSDQLSAIKNEMDDQVKEIDAVVAQTTYNGVNLIDGTFSSSLQTGAATTDTMSIAITQNFGTASLGVGSLDVTATGGASTALSDINAAIVLVNKSMGAVGSYSSALNFTSDLLGTMITNTQAAQGSIMDANVAQVQMQVSTEQILQETATAALSQANTSPDALLKLFQ